MPLDFDNQLFGERNAEISDGGYMYTISDGNAARRGIVSSTATATYQGSFNQMYDLDDTTYFGNLITTADGTVYEIKLDMIKNQENAVVTAYFSAGTTSGGVTVNCKLQHSLDDSTYTDMATAEQTASGTTYKNHSEQVAKFRYLRLRIVCTGGGTGHSNTGRIYFLQVTNV